ncbi:hypothetical protein QJS10_CPA03g00857 [Acorus calamus]|uniref:Uncharacterized protein n=1 Tax=Acorus calamus TaxID=4465 RepID=A0AAV9FC24_ACOCL|nr:hypothetical protein QJS10_CPA03g00857 [Acorus calamus]
MGPTHSVRGKARRNGTRNSRNAPGGEKEFFFYFTAGLKSFFILTVFRRSSGPKPIHDAIRDGGVFWEMGNDGTEDGGVSGRMGTKE